MKKTGESVVAAVAKKASPGKNLKRPDAAPPSARKVESPSSRKEPPSARGEKGKVESGGGSRLSSKADSPSARGEKAKTDSPSARVEKVKADSPSARGDKGKAEVRV